MLHSDSTILAAYGADKDELDTSVLTNGIMTGDVDAFSYAALHVSGERTIECCHQGQVGR